MKMVDYLNRVNLTKNEAALALDVTRVAVSRYCSGARIPDREVMARIFSWSKGRVTPNDFYGVAYNRGKGFRS